MKRIKKVLKPILVIALAVGMSNGAYAADWVEEYNMDFANVQDGADTGLDSVSTAQGFSVAVKNEALELKSDDLFYYEVSSETTEITDLNSSENAHKIEMIETDYGVTQLDSAFEKNSKTYYYEGYKDKAKCIETIGDRAAIKIFTYKDSSKDNDISANQYRFQLDTSRFDSSEKKYTIEVEYYTTDNTNNVLKIAYPTESGRSSVTFYNGNATLNAWTKVSKTVTDADFSRYINDTSESLQMYGNTDTVNYIRSIRIIRVDSNVTTMGEEPHAIKEKIVSGDIYGSVRLSYEMTMPKNIAVKDEVMYNTGKNIMAVDFLEMDGAEVATVLYEIDEETTTISALYTDETSGDDQKQLIYSGDIGNKTLKYVITANMDKTYTAEIYDNADLLGSVSNISINNNSSVTGLLLISHMQIRFSKRSDALYALIDNIKAESKEDENYVNCIEDYTAINDMLPLNPVMDDFELPGVGVRHGSEIEWKSDNSSAIAIEKVNEKIYARVYRSNEDIEDVKLTATVKTSSYTCEGDFFFTVKSMVGQKVMPTEPIIDETAGTASIVVKNLSTSGASSVTFVVAVIDNTTGEVRQMIPDTKTSFTQNQKFSVSGFIKGVNERIEWYLWADNNVSLKNNKPTAVTGLEVINKVRAVELKWNESFDDYNALSGYEVYRDGQLIATVGEPKYKDTGMTTLTAHTYEVVPVDTNMLKGSGDEGAGNTIEPYYIDFSTETPTAKDMALFDQEDSATSYYSQYTSDFSGCRKAADKKFIMIKVDDSLTILDYAEKGGVVIEVEYYDYAPSYPSAGQDVKMMYRKESGGDVIENVFKVENTEKWKTAVVRLPDAVMINSATKSCSIGLRSGSNDPIYIRSVKWMTADLYD